MEKKVKKIGILSALPQEQKYINQLLQSQQEIAKGIIEGKLAGQIIYSTLAGVGKVNAASTTQKLISEYRVDMIFFSGVAGAVNRKLKIGDLIIASRAFQHDYGFYGENLVVHPIGTMPEVGLIDKNKSLYFDLKKNWPEKLYEEFLSQAKRVKLKPIERNNQPYQPQVYSDYVVATGDQFIANPTVKLALVKYKADVVEMEGGSAAQVAIKNNIPILIIRSISDEASNQAAINFINFFDQVAENNALILKKMISLIPN